MRTRIHPYQKWLAAIACAIGLFAACFADDPFADYEWTVKSGDTVVLNDKEFKLISTSDWEYITNSIAKLTVIAERRWTIQHSTESGRREWHGKVAGTVIDEVEKTKTTEYEDGYRYTEKLKAVQSKPRNLPTTSGSATPPSPVRPNNIPAGAWALHQARNSQKAKTVNATVEVGGKVTSVTEVKE